MLSSILHCPQPSQGTTLTHNAAWSALNSRPYLIEVGVGMLGGGQPEAVDLHKLEGGQMASLCLAPQAAHGVQHCGCLASARHPRHIQAPPPTAACTPCMVSPSQCLMITVCVSACCLFESWLGQSLEFQTDRQASSRCVETFAFSRSIHAGGGVAHSCCSNAMSQHFQGAGHIDSVCHWCCRQVACQNGCKKFLNPVLMPCPVSHPWHGMAWNKNNNLIHNCYCKHPARPRCRPASVHVRIMKANHGK